MNNALEEAVSMEIIEIPAAFRHHSYIFRKPYYISIELSYYVVPKGHENVGIYFDFRDDKNTRAQKKFEIKDEVQAKEYFQKNVKEAQNAQSYPPPYHHGIWRQYISHSNFCIEWWNVDRTSESIPWGIYIRQYNGYKTKTQEHWFPFEDAERAEQKFQALVEELKKLEQSFLRSVSVA